MLQPLYSTPELASIFRRSRKATIRYLRALGIQINTKQGHATHITTEAIRRANPQLYQSIALAASGTIEKPFFTVSELAPKFRRTRSGFLRWLQRHQMPLILVGNKNIILASTLLTFGSNQSRTLPS